MILVEHSAVPSEALPLQTFRDYLRLGTGFADDALQDVLLERVLRAAIAAVEGRTSKILLERSFAWSLSAWRDLGRLVFPVAPVRSVASFSIVDRNGAVSAVPATSYRLEQDAHRPAVVAAGFVLPVIPVGGSAEIGFVAGFGATWEEVPADLGHAVIQLATHYYEHRLEIGGEPSLPDAIGAVLGRYRPMRIFGGGY